MKTVKTISEQEKINLIKRMRSYAEANNFSFSIHADTVKISRYYEFDLRTKKCKNLLTNKVKSFSNFEKEITKAEEARAVRIARNRQRRSEIDWEAVGHSGILKKTFFHGVRVTIYGIVFFTGFFYLVFRYVLNF